MTAINSEIFEAFQRDGFAVIEDFYSPPEVYHMLKEAKKIISHAPKEDRVVFSVTDPQLTRKRDQFQIDSAEILSYFFRADAFNEKNELIVPEEFALNRVGHALSVVNDAFKRYTFDNRVREVLWQLGYQRPAVAQSMIIFKNPGVGGEILPHQDGTFLQTEPQSAVGLWIALEDATIENGCLHFISGSHKTGIHRRFIRNPDETSNELLIFDRSLPTYQKSSMIPCPVKKGSLVLIHNQVLHGSKQNTTDKSRTAFTFHVVETKDTKWSPENWLQVKNPFPILYEKDAS
ncbi:CLUMA_CG010910, isoform A [Clunio marinus]|uniref:CLUMA_CG010910, isoform A n=1 Tax=Clunio marinus TaxID=568069 RepID=A0A1J1IGE2_9DIPT|nr:CLUMA_CG010910, isoform A [Clunio marinus]